MTILAGLLALLLPLVVFGAVRVSFLLRDLRRARATESARLAAYVGQVRS